MHARTTTQLNLWSISIGDAGAVAIAARLKDVPLQEVLLMGNRIGVAGRLRIAGRLTDSERSAVVI